MEKIQSDYAHTETDQILSSLESRIKKVYKQAKSEMKQTVKDYFNSFKQRDAKELTRLDAGEITEDQYKQWRLAQIARGQRFQTLQNKLADRYNRANETAIAYTNGSTAEIYALNRNFANYSIEQSGVESDFTLWDEQTVKRLIVNEPDLLPNYPEAKKVMTEKDLAYAKQQVTKCVTSGILQGKSIPKIADDLMEHINGVEQSAAIRAARTATTSAENAGRQDSYEEAESMGIQMEKQWLATLDDRTRPTHQEADGQTVPQDQPFRVGDCDLMYPGDPDGDPCEVHNCRCTMIAKVKGVDTSDAKRWAKDSDGIRYKVSDMTYKEWLEWKKKNR